MPCHSPPLSHLPRCCHSVCSQDEDNYTETSAAALIAYGLVRGIGAGVLEDPGPWRQSVAFAVEGLEGRVTGTSGARVVEGTSFGTVPGSYEEYTSVVQLDDIILGWGSLVMVLAEADGMGVD